MRGLSYADRLSALVLDRFETQRLRFDLIYLYKILFGKVDIEWSNMFEFAALSVTRGHCYKLFVERSRINIRQKFFCNRIVSVWNNLRAEPEHFCSLSAFINFVKNTNLSELDVNVALANVYIFYGSTVLRMFLLCLTRLGIIIQRKLSTSKVVMLLLE